MSSSLTYPVPSSSKPANAHYTRYAPGSPPTSATAEPYGIEWTTLRPGSIIVDVGGGLGTSCLNLANTYPHLRFVVQDRPGEGASVQLANAYCHASNGRVKFQVHDIFSPQNIHSPAILVLKHIVPRLSDSDVRKVLTSLRLAAAPGTQLVLVDGEHHEGRTPRHVSQLLRSAGWGVARAHMEPGRTHPVRIVFAAPV